MLACFGDGFPEGERERRAEGLRDLFAFFLLLSSEPLRFLSSLWLTSWLEAEGLRCRLAFFSSCFSFFSFPFSLARLSGFPPERDAEADRLFCGLEQLRRAFFFLWRIEEEERAAVEGTFPDPAELLEGEAKAPLLLRGFLAAWALC